MLLPEAPEAPVSGNGDPEVWHMLACKARVATNEVTHPEARRILTIIADAFDALERMARG
jgi:hypothetical protein